MSGFEEEQARLEGAPVAEAPYDMANLYPRSTGLPMTVWVSPRGAARHDARVKVCRVHGNRMVPDQLASVTIRPEPRLIEGELPNEDLAAVSAWIRLNENILLAYWDGTADTTDLVQGLRPLR
jgi:hypothetical protein